MAAEWICDGCGKRERAHQGRWEFKKPLKWFERGDKDGIQSACSRECIERIAKKTGKTSVVLPL